VRDLYSFFYNHKDSEKFLSDICYREVVQFVAGATIDSDTEENSAGLGGSILGAGRAQAALQLKERIQARADENGLGVEIIFLGLQGFHPPTKVANDYEAVIGSVQKKQALVLAAMANRNQNLTTLAGSVEKADELYKKATQYQNVKGSVDAAAAKQQAAALDAAFGDAQGDIFAALRQAQSYSYEKVALARADSERFVGQLLAYRASPKIYKNEQMLSMLEDALVPIRKYIVAIDPADREVLTIDLQEKLNPSLYELTGIEGNKK
jgi:regulator of protease activity HflC (stomatin/prohibitin superfamily)